VAGELKARVSQLFAPAELLALQWSLAAARLEAELLQPVAAAVVVALAAELLVVSRCRKCSELFRLDQWLDQCFVAVQPWLDSSR
jgi:hypothetical protein